MAQSESQIPPPKTRRIKCWPESCTHHETKGLCGQVKPPKAHGLSVEGSGPQRKIKVVLSQRGIWTLGRKNNTCFPQGYLVLCYIQSPTLHFERDFELHQGQCKSKCKIAAICRVFLCWAYGDWYKTEKFDTISKFPLRLGRERKNPSVSGLEQ